MKKELKVKDLSVRFPELDQFLGGFFHLDWAQVMDWNGAEPNFQEVVRYYKNSESPEHVSQTIMELRQLLSEIKLEKNLENILRESVDYVPTLSGMSYRQWLEEILIILEDSSKLQSDLRFKQQPMWTGWQQYSN